MDLLMKKNHTRHSSKLWCNLEVKESKKKNKIILANFLKHKQTQDRHLQEAVWQAERTRWERNQSGILIFFCYWNIVDA